MAEVIVRKRGVTGTAKAVFVCLSKKCPERTEDGAPTFELPVAAQRCPVCGSKRLERVWAGFAPNVSSGIAKRVDAVVKPGYEIQQERKDIAKAAQREAPMFSVPMNQLGGIVSQFGGSLNAPMGTRVSSDVGDGPERIRPSNAARPTMAHTPNTSVARSVGRRADVKLVSAEDMGGKVPRNAQRIDGSMIEAALQEQRAKVGR